MKAGGKSTWSRIWVGSMVAALVAAVGVFLLMLHLEKQALSDYEKDYIYVAEKEIPRGVRITEKNFAEYMTLKEMDKSMIPDTAIKSGDQIMESVAKERIETGVLLTTGMFEAFREITAEMEQPVIAGFKADDLYQVAGGVLRAGDRIHIYTVSEDGHAGLVWESVYVEQAFDSAGNAIGVENATSPAQRMNVYLDAADVEYFYTELARGTLRVVKVCD
ncbi:MAG: SAF domain-containing protein [Lachnospiraceae bacterium]|nr:SAF domain-containing protein [Lachnospiraceae bacterium]